MLKVKIDWQNLMLNIVLWMPSQTVRFKNLANLNTIKGVFYGVLTKISIARQ